MYKETVIQNELEILDLQRCISEDIIRQHELEKKSNLLFMFLSSFRGAELRDTEHGH